MTKTNQHREEGQGMQSDQSLSDRAKVTQLVNEGAGLLRQGQAQQAVPLLREAWELDPTEVATAINLAGAYILLKRHREAVPVLQSAVSLDPENAMIWMNLGAAHLGNPVLATTEDQERAIEAFERAAELEPELANINYNLGLIYRDQKRWEQARVHFRRALDANPEDRDAERLWEEMGTRLVEELDQDSAEEEN